MHEILRVHLKGFQLSRLIRCFYFLRKQLLKFVFCHLNEYSIRMRSFFQFLVPSSLEIPSFYFCSNFVDPVLFQSWLLLFCSLNLHSCLLATRFFLFVNCLVGFPFLYSSKYTRYYSKSSCLLPVDWVNKGMLSLFQRQLLDLGSNLYISFPASIPCRKFSFSVLSAPHVYKKFRHHYIRSLHHWCFDLYGIPLNNLSLFLQGSILFGLGFKVEQLQYSPGC